MRSPMAGASLTTMVVTPSLAATPSRQLAIDVMRGLTLALMMVVNMSISDEQVYGQLAHARWHGLTLTDLVFPSFLFVVGAAMAFTLPRYQALGQAAFVTKVARRSALIFLCGFLLYWFPFFTHDSAGQLIVKPLSQARIPGVLQRIAWAYALAACVIHVGGRRGAWGFVALTLPLYAWVLTAFGDDTLAGNAVLKLDRWMLGDDHLYHGEGVPFDPEGVLSTLPAVVNVLVGWLAGSLLRERGATDETVSRLLIAAVVCVVIGLGWDRVLPFNKKLWTSSYAVVSSGVALAVLALLVAVVDVRGWRGRWTFFFEVFGRNTLALYLMCEISMAAMWLTEVQGKSIMLWIYESVFQSWAGDKPGSLLFALAFMLCWWAVGWRMDRQKIYIKL